MRLKRLVVCGILVTGAASGLGLAAMADENASPPSGEQVASAQRTSDLMLATLFAALTKEFDETTVENAAEGKRSISLVFNDHNEDMRLVGAHEPIQENNLPSDAFERKAHKFALMGKAYTDVERVNDQWYYRRSVPLSNFRVECSYCHTNFPAGPTPDWTGALMLRVPIK